MLKNMETGGEGSETRWLMFAHQIPAIATNRKNCGRTSVSDFR